MIGGVPVISVNVIKLSTLNYIHSHFNNKIVVKVHSILALPCYIYRSPLKDDTPSILDRLTADFLFTMQIIIQDSRIPQLYLTPRGTYYGCYSNKPNIYQNNEMK